MPNKDGFLLPNECSCGGDTEGDLFCQECRDESAKLYWAVLMCLGTGEELEATDDH